MELSHEHDLQLISELNNLRGKYDEVLERAKELEIIISKLQVENAALKTSDLEGQANEESLNAIEHDGLFHHTLTTNVRDEMEDLDVVRYDAKAMNDNGNWTRPQLVYGIALYWRFEECWVIAIIIVALNIIVEVERSVEAAWDRSKISPLGNSWDKPPNKSLKHSEPR